MTILGTEMTRVRLFKILEKVIHWKSLSTGQLLIQWTASQWITLIVQKQRLWLTSYPLDNILSSVQLPWFFALTVYKQTRPKIKKFSDISSWCSSIYLCDMQMIYDQSFCCLCVRSENLCLHWMYFKSYGNHFLLREMWIITHLFSI